MRREHKELLRDWAWSLGLAVPVGALVTWLVRVHSWWSPLSLGALGGFLVGAPAVAVGLAMADDDWDGPDTARRKLANASLFLFTLLLVPTCIVSKTDFFVAHVWPVWFDIGMRVLASLPFAAFFIASLTLRAKPSELLSPALRASLHGPTADGGL